MAASHDLVQRFLDNDLSAEERVRFIARLGRDEALRHQLIDLEQLVLDASRLPRPVVPDGFVDRVLERTVPVRPTWRRWADTFLAPRTLRWNLASATAVACLALIVVAGLIAWRVSAPAGSAPSGADASPAVAGQTPPTVLIRLVLVQPGARTVEVAGDFNGWDPVRTPLEPVSGGAWAVTIPLQPGRYQYMFVVNGQQWMTDPFAAERNDDGFGSQNAVLDVRPPMGAV